MTINLETLTKLSLAIPSLKNRNLFSLLKASWQHQREGLVHAERGLLKVAEWKPVRAAYWSCTNHDVDLKGLQYTAAFHKLSSGSTGF